MSYSPGPGEGASFNSLAVFDGGTKGLSAVNIMGLLPPASAMAAANGNPRNPFFFRTVPG